MTYRRLRGTYRARECFEEALRAHPGDACSRLHVERCRQLRESPPAADWDGVSKLTSK